MKTALGIIFLFSIMLLSCKQEPLNHEWKPLRVKATAYNSVRAQTDNDPNVAAWGDTLQPGMKVIAVSRDLLSLGLKRNTEVIIEGLPGIYLVKDKMNSRYRKRIDIYMGIDIEGAKEWGQKRLKIQYKVEKEEVKRSVE